MPRVARQIATSGIYHIMLRGINRQQIFEDDEDYQRMLQVLSGLHRQYSPLGERMPDTCCIYAYCLMGNHLHLLIRELDWTISELIKSLASTYVFYYNRKYGRIGHLFQDRFKSETCDDMSYFITLLRYIHQNPIKAGITLDANYRWSSWHEFVEPTVWNICSTGAIFKRITFLELNELVHKSLPEDCGCIELDENEIEIQKTDSQIKIDILQLSKCRTIAEFQRLEIKKTKTNNNKT